MGLSLNSVFCSIDLYVYSFTSSSFLVKFFVIDLRVQWYISSYFVLSSQNYLIVLGPSHFLIHYMISMSVAAKNMLGFDLDYFVNESRYWENCHFNSVGSFNPWNHIFLHWFRSFKFCFCNVTWFSINIYATTYFIIFTPENVIVFNTIVMEMFYNLFSNYLLSVYRNAADFLHVSSDLGILLKSLITK